MPTNNRQSRRTADRRAILIFAVLACLTLAAIFSSVWLRLISLEREQTRLQQAALQTEYLAASGLARAEAQLAASADYAGETWEPEPGSLDTSAPAKIIIEITPTDAPAKRKISVTAELQGSGSSTVVRRRDRTLELPVPPVATETTDSENKSSESSTPAPSTTELSPSEESSP